MDVRERFPVLAGVAPSIADTSADLTNPLNLFRLTSVVTAAPVAAKSIGGPGKMQEVAASLVREFIDAGTIDDDQLQLHLLQLASTIEPLEWCLSQHRVAEAWRWAVFAMAEDFSPATDALVDVARPFNASTTLLAVGPDLVLRWAGGICLLAWASGYLKTEATIAAEIIDPVLLQPLGPGVTRRAVEAASHIVVWQHRTGFGHPEPVISRFVEILDASDERQSTRLAAGRALATSVGELSGVNRQTRASELLELFPDLHPTEHLQLHATALAENLPLLLEQFDDLLDEVDEHVRSVQANAADPLTIASARGRLWSIAVGVVADLVSGGEADSAVRMLKRWFGLAAASSSRQGIVAIRRVDGVTWACQGCVDSAPTAFGDMLEVFNEVLDASLVDPSTTSTSVHRPVRGGQPDPSGGIELHQTLVDGMRPDIAASVAATAVGPPSVLFNLAFERAPLSWLIAEAGGPVLPVACSMQEPLSDRSLSRAEIWYGDLLGAKEEADAVAEILHDAGCAVEVVAGQDAGVDGFRSSYESNELDLLWVSGHASFGHDSVEATELELAADQTLSLRDLMDLRTPRVGRRLLVLNSCESAVVEGLGGPSTIGVGGLLAGSTQAVVCHLWPTHFKAAARFGVLLALGLSERSGFVGAFASTLRSLIGGPDAVRDRMSAHPAAEGIARLWDPASSAGFVEVASPVFLE